MVPSASRSSTPFLSAGYCHCTRCQRRTGTASSANARAEPGSVRDRAGRGGAARLGAAEGGREKVFCVRCGSALFSCEPGSGVYTGVRLGAIDGDPGIRPEARAFVAYAACWEEIPDAAFRGIRSRRRDRQRDADCPTRECHAASIASPGERRNRRGRRRARRAWSASTTSVSRLSTGSGASRLDRRAAALR